MCLWRHYCDSQSYFCDWSWHWFHLVDGIVWRRHWFHLVDGFMHKELYDVSFEQSQWCIVQKITGYMLRKTLFKKLLAHQGRIQKISFKKMHFKMSSAKCQPFCFGHVLSILWCLVSKGKGIIWFSFIFYWKLRAQFIIIHIGNGLVPNRCQAFT